MITISSTDDTVFRALGDFLTQIMPADFEVEQAQVNRVAEPKADDFAMMTILRRDRIATNMDSSADVSFTASIATATMTVTAVEFGNIGVGNTVFGTGVADDTSVVAQVSGLPGGTGTYTVTPEQNTASQPMAAGIYDYVQPTMIAVQLDVHGPNSGANAQKITTLFRDGYAATWFQDNFPDVAPLLADDPKQLPFINEQQQYETRWVIEARMQVNVTVTAPQQYADQLEISGFFEVDTTYPPT